MRIFLLLVLLFCCVFAPLSGMSHVCMRPIRMCALTNRLYGYTDGQTIGTMENNIAMDAGAGAGHRIPGSDDTLR